MRIDRQDPPESRWRRRFLQGIGAGAALLGLHPVRGFAQELRAGGDVLRGTRFNLHVGEMPVNFTGQARVATVVNNQLPAPTLVWREGDDIAITVTNRLDTTTSIHWHGILLPFAMDGVPGISFRGIAPGESFTYRFTVKQTGTYWYHSHSRFQEQTGLYGPIVVVPRNGERERADREYVVMLSDWTDESPERVFANLKKMSGFFNMNQPTLGDLMRDIREMGTKAAFDKRAMWNRMRMLPTDLSDVTGAAGVPGAARYLLNGRTSAHNWTALSRPGERVRLRFINGSATTIFDVRISGLKMAIVSADGQDVHPVEVDEFRISVAETYDAIVQVPDDAAYTIFAQSIDRTGYVRGTLAPRAGMAAPVPPLEEPQWLTMRDMMGAMDHGDMHGGGHEGMQHEPAHEQQMDHSKMDHGQMDHGQMDHSKMGHAMPAPATGEPLPPPMARHARTEYGPGVDMRVDMPRTNLDDPGINLRDNGRRVLTYADLRTVGGALDARPPSRTIELHLTGNMERFMWSFDGQKFSEAKPIRFRYGERVRIVLVNDTMMNHPIHLHGMWGELETPEGEFQVRKHTFNVQPAQRVTYLVTADAPGHWAYHCHLLYHMEAGMFREVVVS